MSGRFVRGPDGLVVAVDAVALGQGGTANVFPGRVIDPGALQLPDNVAVKVLQPGLRRKAAWASQFVESGRRASMISHPNLVRLFCACDPVAEGLSKHEQGEIDAPWILMEHLSPVSLDRMRPQLQQQFGNSWLRGACTIVGGVLRGLEAVHAGGLVHRDVKPGNVLFSDRQEPKLSDFTSARLSKPGVVTNMHGTPAFMAPEQRLRPRAVDHRADLYGVGTTLTWLVRAVDPFYLFHDEHRRAVLTGVHSAVAAVIDRACQFDPARRFASAAEMLEALNEAARSLGEQAPEPGSAAPSLQEPSTWTSLTEG
ncbi:MAG: serine/threonine protein kinase [Alphaproteobacteria bacterium]|nr:serine/threonine protein kinase [Alphaproteobacteria bacterium]